MKKAVWIGSFGLVVFLALYAFIDSRILGSLMHGWSHQTVTIEIPNGYVGFVRIVEAHRSKSSLINTKDGLRIRVNDGGFAFVPDLDEVFRGPSSIHGVTQGGRSSDVYLLGIKAELTLDSSITLAVLWAGGHPDMERVRAPSPRT